MPCPFNPTNAAAVYAAGERTAIPYVVRHGLDGVAGFAPDTGETPADLTGRFPGSSLGPTLAPIVLP
ncbi:MAG: hypothetical protein ACJ8KA_03310, partial [Sulfurifustis sp.]